MSAEVVVRNAEQMRARIERNSVALSCGCRIWLGGTTPSRTGAEYPVLTVRLPGVPHPVKRRVHRIVAELRDGPLPYGYEVDHECTNTLCVAEAHLAVVPASVNRAQVGRRAAWAGV